MIAIVDTGGANIASVQNALERLEVKSQLTSDCAEIENASHVILPGVGAALNSMTRLQNSNLVDVIRNLSQPVLGICLGMQLLFESSEEGGAACLGVLPGVVRRMSAMPGFSIPHMGWNQVDFFEDAPLSQGLRSGEYFYFVHSFVVPMGEWINGYCSYSQRIPAMVSRRNFHGVQFHPERSAAAGARLLRNFVNL